MTSWYTSSRFDLSKYLNIDYSSYLTPNKIQNYDILKWWKSHESTFLVLSKMTHDLLTPLVFIVVLKSNFSIATNNWRKEAKTHTRDDRVLGMFEGLQRLTHGAPNL